MHNERYAIEKIKTKKPGSTKISTFHEIVSNIYFKKTLEFFEIFEDGPISFDLHVLQLLDKMFKPN